MFELSDGKVFYIGECECECKKTKVKKEETKEESCRLEIKVDLEKIITDCKKHLGKKQWQEKEYVIARLINHNFEKMSKYAKEKGLQKERKARAK